MITSPNLHPLRRHDGFTLVELLIVLVIVAVLLALAVPAFLLLGQRAQRSETAASLRAAIPAAEAWHSDHDTYVGMTAALLAADYDSGINTSKLSVASASQTGYTLFYDSNGALPDGCTATFVGPAGTTSITHGGDCP
jgi:prepilin-type N-terminal cleavage/methylation domain-containing protein